MKKDSAQEVTDSVSYLLEANSMKVPTSLTNPCHRCPRTCCGPWVKRRTG